MTSGSVALGAILTAVLIAVPSPALGHGDIPHLTMLDVRADDHTLTVEVLLEPRLFDAWAGRERPDPFAIAPSEATFVHGKAFELLTAALRLTLDDQPALLVPSMVAMIEIPHPPGMVTYLRVIAAAPLARAPRRVAVAWGRWDGLPDEPLGEIPVSIAGPGGDAVATLTPGEPELVWHAPDTPVPPPRGAPPGLPSADPARGWSIVAALALALSPLALACGVIFRARRWVRRVAVRVPLAVAMVCGAIAAWHAYGLAPAEPATLAPDAALATAEALVRQMYAAFDETRDEAIYDALGLAVEGRLLERVYADVHGALVMREAGGATCRVVAVEIGERALDAPERPIAGGYGSTVAWVVRARVAHWGHVHARDLAYRARLAIRHTPGGWRIAAIETTDLGLAPAPR